MLCFFLIFFCCSSKKAIEGARPVGKGRRSKPSYYGRQGPQKMQPQWPSYGDLLKKKNQQLVKGWAR
jgi:hypothetical protein